MVCGGSISQIQRSYILYSTYILYQPKSIEWFKHYIYLPNGKISIIQEEWSWIVLIGLTFSASKPMKACCLISYMSIIIQKENMFPQDIHSWIHYAYMKVHYSSMRFITSYFCSKKDLCIFFNVILLGPHISLSGLELKAMPFFIIDLPMCSIPFKYVLWRIQIRSLRAFILL